MSQSNRKWMRRLRGKNLGFVLSVYTPLAAVCVFVGIHVMADARWLGYVFFFAPLLLPPTLYLAGARLSFTVAASILVPLELLAVFLAQYTLLGLYSVFVLFLVWANVIPIGYQFLKGETVSATTWILLSVIAAAVIIPQAWLGLKLVRLECEAKRIIVYSYELKLRTGTFPTNLSHYSWTHKDLRDHFAFYGHGSDNGFTYPFTDSPHYDQSDKFSLRYFVGSRDTAYWFSSKEGWFVEDD